MVFGGSSELQILGLHSSAVAKTIFSRFRAGVFREHPTERKVQMGLWNAEMRRWLAKVRPLRLQFRELNERWSAMEVFPGVEEVLNDTLAAIERNPEAPFAVTPASDGDEALRRFVLAELAAWFHVISRREGWAKAPFIHAAIATQADVVASWGDREWELAAQAGSAIDRLINADRAASSASTSVKREREEPLRCNHCNQPGHFRRECPLLAKPAQAAERQPPAASAAATPKPSSSTSKTVVKKERGPT